MIFRLLVLLFCLLFVSNVFGNWHEWWTYDGISGPEYWGLINHEWRMCEEGRMQSPININPARLVYDPHLRRIHVEKDRIQGILHNTGQSLIFQADREAKYHIHISGGPLVYRYRFDRLYIHFGFGNGTGSEHHINGNAFAAEIQLYGYNTQLYPNITAATLGSNGIVGISILVMIDDDKSNDELRVLQAGFDKVKYRGDKWPIPHLSIEGLLPKTNYFMTYLGSTTFPGCWETTTWVIMNKPIYISFQQLSALRNLMQGNKDSPKSKMANNFRPVRHLHHRIIRTNIDYTNRDASGCPSMRKEQFYAARQWNFS